MTAMAEEQSLAETTFTARSWPVCWLLGKGLILPEADIVCQIE